MPVTRVGVQAVTGSPGQIVDIDPARISATITNAGSVAVEYSTGGAWTSIAVSGSASFAGNTNELRLRRTGSGGYPVPVDIDWTAQSEGEANSLTAAQASSLVSGAWNAATSGTWRTATLGAIPRFSASGGASGGTWTLNYRNKAGVVTTDSAESVAANVTDVSPVFLDDATEIMVTVTGTVTVEMK